MKEFALGLDLQNDGVELVEPNISDALDVFEYGSDPEFCRHLSASPFVSEVEARLFIESLIEANNRGERLYWMIRCDGKIVGTIGFIFGAASKGGKVEIGYGVSRKYWGKGVFSRALRIIEVVALRMKKSKLIAGTSDENRRNALALEKCGFVHEKSEVGYVWYGLTIGPDRV
jgi:RimJ/RimL family protein N-acetyltransferase